MEKIKIEKTIYVRDKYKVKRQAFLAGQEVDRYEYDAVLSANAVVNPEDLPKEPVKVKRSLETKMLPVSESLPETVVYSEEEEVKEEVADEKEATDEKTAVSEKGAVTEKEAAPKKSAVKKAESKKKAVD